MDDAGDVVVVVDGVREEVEEDDVREEDLLGIQFVKYIECKVLFFKFLVIFLKISCCIDILSLNENYTYKTKKKRNQNAHTLMLTFLQVVSRSCYVPSVPW